LLQDARQHFRNNQRRNALDSVLFPGSRPTPPSYSEGHRRIRAAGSGVQGGSILTFGLAYRSMMSQCPRDLGLAISSAKGPKAGAMPADHRIRSDDLEGVENVRRQLKPRAPHIWEFETTDESPAYDNFHGIDRLVRARKGECDPARRRRAGWFGHGSTQA
jgi:hypothetical protein